MSEREERDRQERTEQKELLRKEKEKEKLEAAQKEEEAKLRSDSKGFFIHTYCSSFEQSVFYWQNEFLLILMHENK